MTDAEEWVSVIGTGVLAKTAPVEVAFSDGSRAERTGDQSWRHKKGDNLGFPQAVKQDSNKPMPELLPFAALVEVSEVLAYGAKKYAPGNWRKGLLWTRLLGAALRHLFAWGGGEDKDPETGRSHLAHAACCVLFLLDYEMTGGYADLDDRKNGRPEG